MNWRVRVVSGSSYHDHDMSFSSSHGLAILFGQIHDCPLSMWCLCKPMCKGNLISGTELFGVPPVQAQLDATFKWLVVDISPAFNVSLPICKMTTRTDSKFIQVHGCREDTSSVNSNITNRFLRTFVPFNNWKWQLQKRSARCKKASNCTRYELNQCIFEHNSMLHDFLLYFWQLLSLRRYRSEICGLKSEKKWETQCKCSTK